MTRVTLHQRARRKKGPTSYERHVIERSDSFTLDPHTRKQAEHALNAYSRQSAFFYHLLQFVLATINDTVRFTASVYLYLKNRVGFG